MSRTRALAAGVLCANSLPHLACAAAGRRMLTPLGGRESSPAVNAVWGAANLAGGLVLVSSAVRRGEDGRGELNAFGAGAALIAVWGAVGERVFRFNG
ncbi:hypothetical protein [Brachybacterium sp. YJGR34]|uniref:hypothetical protein n=1 Tax=Brachybacterium sp. YJGR34 TaxID=2059911 RepID=UPI000E0A5D1F|nr:hypothetical protein [Brachybacterium sp. YJGR34]